MNVETPLDIQHPDDHIPTVEELMLNVQESIAKKDAMISAQREQLESVRNMLKDILYGSTSKDADARVGNEQGNANEGSPQAVQEAGETV